VIAAGSMEDLAWELNVQGDKTTMGESSCDFRELLVEVALPNLTYNDQTQSRHYLCCKKDNE
jgi:hypothetical protein